MTDVANARATAGVLLAGVALAAVVGSWNPYAGTAAGMLGVAAAGVLAYGPSVRAVARRSRALGAAPDIVGLVVLSLRLDPAVERATWFAAEHGDGRLAASLAAHAREARGRPGTGFEAFADTWADHLPSLRRAAALADAAVEAPAADRERLLDRTLAVVASGAQERASEYADAVHGPTTAVYAFGVVLPLALVGVAPAAASAGVPVTVGAVALGYGVALPLAVVAAVCWILARRPVAFPPAAIPPDHPGLDGRRRRTVLAGACGVVAAIAVSAILPAWALPVLLVGWPLGGALACWFEPACRIRADARDVEAGLADAISVVGHRIRNGRSVEAAVADAGGTLDGATGDVFAAAARRMQRLRVGVEAGFLGDHGPLAQTRSQRARAAVSLLVHAADAGRPGGRVLVDVADLFDDLTRLDRTVRRTFAATTRTLRHTALVYAPLVAGVTVALAGRISGIEGATALPSEQLALSVGGYVLWLAAALPALAVGLERGLDRALVGYHGGVTLATAAAVYPVTAVAAGTVL